MNDPRLAALRERIRDAGPSVVAFSGGVDSALVLKVAHDILGDEALGLTAVSPSLPKAEETDALAFASELGIRLEILHSREVEDPRYAANPTNRCYFCKSELYELCKQEAARRGYRSILDGVNRDDLGDHRPGLVAATELAVRHPLVEAGLGKQDVRELARALDLRVWDKPAFACLASRFPHGTAITPERLAQVERCEQALRELGFASFRVRYHGEIARIEVPPDDLPSLVAPEPRAAIIAAAKAAGFRFVTLDLEGYRMGSVSHPALRAVGA